MEGGGEYNYQYNNCLLTKPEKIQLEMAFPGLDISHLTFLGNSLR